MIININYVDIFNHFFNIVTNIQIHLFGKVFDQSNNMYKHLSLILISLTAYILGYSQEYPKDYFRSPIDMPIFLAGNFGEIRSGHFHAGLDIKTDGVEGKNIYTSADGYISRIKITHGGYGKVLYVTHPNGYTTTYAHLQRFNDKIEAYCKRGQYQKESYEIELFPSKDDLPVTKGDVIAISGNSGGSGGPHLHFEIRETATETPVNPLLFGFDVKDEIKPTIKSLGIYPVDGGQINGSPANKLLIVTGDNGNYKLGSTLKASGKIGLGIDVLDKTTGSNNRCGVYSIELIIDSVASYCHEMNKISFNETRYINSHVCYEHWKKDDARVQRSYIQPNNKLDVYACDKKNYVFDFNDNKIHHLSYIVRDAHMNTSVLEFDIQAVNTDSSIIAKTDTSFSNRLFKYNAANSFETEDLKISLPANILYDDLQFKYEKQDPVGRAITPIHHIHDIYTPLHSYMTLSIKVDSINPKYENKALIVALDDKLSFLASEGGEYDNGWITIKTRSFGPYTVMIDTIAPTIKPYNVVSGRDMSTKDALMMTISDDMSGIDSYRGTIDGKWVLFEYDYKKDRLTYFFDKNRLEKGKNHTLKMVVADKRNNKSEYSIDFFW